MPLPSLTSSKGFSLHFEWNPNSLPWPISCTLARACLPRWPHLVLSSSTTLGFSCRTFLFLGHRELAAVLGFLHELSPLPGMLFTQILCLDEWLSFRSLCKCHFLKEASHLGFSLNHFLSIPVSVIIVLNHPLSFIYSFVSCLLLLEGKLCETCNWSLYGTCIYRSQPAEFNYCILSTY